MSIKFKDDNYEKNFHAIGFDMDHTFVRYKFKEFIEIIDHCLITFFIKNKNYPIELMKKNKEEILLMENLCSKCFFDKKTSNFIKVSEDNEVLRAWNGFHKLSSNEIREIYGKDMKLDKNINLNINSDPNFVEFIDQYHYASVGLFCKIVEMRKSGKYEVLNNLKNEQLFNDYFEGWQSMAFHYDKENKNILKISKYGLYFPELINNMDKYFYKIDEEFLKTLKDLKNKGVFIFMVTNSHWESMDKWLRFAVGDNYKDYFNLINVNSCKPNFWDKEDPFKNVVVKGEDEISIGDFTNFEDNNAKIRGNVKDLNTFFESKYGKDYKVLYYGDSISSDMHFLDHKLNKNWKINFIFEESQEIEEGINYNYYSNFKTIWGSPLFDRNNNGQIVKTTLFDYVNKKANRLVSVIYNERNCNYFKKILRNIE